MRYKDKINKLRELSQFIDNGDRSFRDMHSEIGVCSKALVSKYSREYSFYWHKCSGLFAFPVPHESMPPNEAFDLCRLWANDQYGDDRREYCAFLADCLERRGYLEDVIDECRRLAAGGEPADPDYGLCFQIKLNSRVRLKNDVSVVIDQIIRSFGDGGIYPIPNYNLEQRAGALWQNPKRLELCAFVADEIEKNLVEYSAS